MQSPRFVVIHVGPEWIVKHIAEIKFVPQTRLISPAKDFNGFHADFCSL